MTRIEEYSPGAVTRRRDALERALASSLGRSLRAITDATARTVIALATDPSTALALSAADIEDRWAAAVLAAARETGVSEDTLAAYVDTVSLPAKVYTTARTVLDEITAAQADPSTRLSRSAVERTVRDALAPDTGTSIEVPDRLTAAVGEVGRAWDSDMTMLARTLATSEESRRTVEALRALGVTGKRWVAHIDVHTRPWHLDANGLTGPLDSAFLVGGEFMQWPGDPSASMENTANCRCVLAAVSL